jgi:ACT domain
VDTDRDVAQFTLVAVPDRPGVARRVFDPLARAGINVDVSVRNVGRGGSPATVEPSQGVAAGPYEGAGETSVGVPSGVASGPMVQVSSLQRGGWCTATTRPSSLRA